MQEEVMRQYTVIGSALVLSTFSLLNTPASAGTAETVAACSATTATAPAFAACVGSALTLEEANKCFSSGFKDCVGPHNDARRFVENNVVGPAKDMLSGELGRSPKSVWRQIGLPRVRLW
jgi:hypothetical protein